MFLADLARDPTNQVPIQATSSTVLAVFLFTGTFVVNYIRMYFPKANFGCVFACIILTITLTNASGIGGFQPTIMYMILIPIATGTAIALAVAILLWPEDTITTFLNVLSLSIDDYNTFFKAQSEDFISLSETSSASTLPELHASMQRNLLLLIDCKRTVQREVLYTYLSGKDCSKITRLVKEMRNPLHGIGFSLLKKKQGLKSLDEDETDAFSCVVTDQERQAFKDALIELTPLFSELADLNYELLAATSKRFAQFGNSPRTAISTFLWPFVRFNLFNKRDNHSGSGGDADIEKNNKAYDPELEFKYKIERLQDLISSMETTATPGMVKFLETIHSQEENDPRYGLLYILFCYQMNLKTHSLKVIALAEESVRLVHDRQSKRLWLPSITWKKWFRTGEVDPQVGGDDINTTSNGQGLIRTSTRPDNLDDDNMATGQDENSRDSSRNSKNYNKTHKSKRFLPLDPDIYPPSNKRERFFYSLYLFKKWCVSINTFFAFKTAVAVVLLSIPAYRVDDAAWFNQWRGQWAQISLVLWLFPMAGLFYSSMLLRLIGTILGGILGIVIWEISRGNPYGISILCFVCFLFLQYAFFFGPMYAKPVSLLITVTLGLVVIYEYQYVQDQVPNHDAVYVVAGKRVLLVCIGLVAASILNMIPTQVTGRVELRRRLAITITQIGRLYSLLASSYMVPHEQLPTENQKKMFRKLALEVQRQIADERTLLANALFEPPLRGKFPFKEYTILLQSVENMADLVESMVYAAKSIENEWRSHISSVMMLERKDYLSSIMVTLKLTTGSLASKMTYPPFLITPAVARHRFNNAVEKKLRIQRRDLDVNTLPNFAAFGVYLLASQTFVTELELARKTVTEMVGIDDPYEWKEHYK
ncbi:hypothetical protein BCR42DRAFT_81199 [Absidia repens]|uniref:Fusaric acid resistance protein-like-domain-containing protein n=1 Tax=Absidia repens TaxID=90262 RepID=A0A1X2I9N7_9FUNG|nr:hypothetical protein BCR42DRAFT_81199 [Absidia repens]